MEDREIRIFFQIFLFMATIIIVSFSRQPKVLMIGAPLSFILGYIAPWLFNMISKTFIDLIYGSGSGWDSYQDHFYQEDMDRAKKLVREGNYYQAISLYREIIQKVPMIMEPRFNLAKIYQLLGHKGLALNEYKKILSLRDQLGESHPFILESKMAIERLANKTSVSEQDLGENLPKEQW